MCPIHYPQPLQISIICKNKLSVKSANPFKSVNLIKYSVIHGLHAKPTFYPYHYFPLISLVSVHMLSKQGNAHPALQITLWHLPLKPLATNINYPALTTTSLIII